MGLLSAFVGGALGKGVTDAVDRMTRRDELAAAERRRLDEKEEDRRFREEQQRRDLMARYGSDGSAPGMGRGRAGTASGRAAAIARDELEIGEDARALMGAQGLSDPEIEQIAQAKRSGQNPYTREVDRDPSMVGPRQASDFKAEPDEERFRKTLGAYNRALFQARHAGSSSADDTAKANETYRQQDLESEIIAGGGKGAGLISAARAAGKGAGLFKESGGTLYNEHTGAGGPTDVGRSEMRRNDASAADHNASAGKKGDERKALTENGGMTAGERVGLLRSYEDAAQRLGSDSKALRGDIAKATAGLAKLGGEQRKAEVERIDGMKAELQQLDERARKASADADAQRESGRQRGQGKPAGDAKGGGKDLAGERARAEAAIRGGKDPAAVKRRFKEITGTDF